MTEKKCIYWYSENKKTLEFEHNEKAPCGFCILRELFTECNGACESYNENKEITIKTEG